MKVLSLIKSDFRRTSKELLPLALFRDLSTRDEAYAQSDNKRYVILRSQR